MTEDDIQKLVREIGTAVGAQSLSAIYTLRHLNERGMLIDEGAVERVAKVIWDGGHAGLTFGACDAAVRKALYPAPVDDPDEVVAFEVFKAINGEYNNVTDAKMRSPQTFQKYVAAIRRGRELERGK